MSDQEIYEGLMIADPDLMESLQEIALAYEDREAYLGNIVRVTRRVHDKVMHPFGMQDEEGIDVIVAAARYAWSIK